MSRQLAASELTAGHRRRIQPVPTQSRGLELTAAHLYCQNVFTVIPSPKDCAIPQPEGYRAWPAVPDEKQLPMSMQSPGGPTGALTDVGQFSGWPKGCQSSANRTTVYGRSGLTVFVFDRDRRHGHPL